MISKEALSELYWNKNISMEKIGRQLGRCLATIRYWMVKYDIPRRTLSEAHKGQVPWHKGKSGVYSTEILKRMSEGHTGKKFSEESKDKHRVAMTRQWAEGRRSRVCSVETRRKISLTKTGNASHRKGLSLEAEYGKEKAEEIRAKMSEAWRYDKHCLSDVARKNISNIHRQLWSDLAYRERVIHAQRMGANIKPNQLEQKLMAVIERHSFPFKYVGDGSVVIYGLNPDFIECNGKKQIIEVFGNYWHTERVRKWFETEEGRKAVFAQLGYDTLILWEHELQDEKAVVEKIQKFM